jgi:hypothetical protein
MVQAQSFSLQNIHEYAPIVILDPPLKASGTSAIAPILTDELERKYDRSGEFSFEPSNSDS